MANSAAPEDANGLKLGFIMKKVSTTLTSLIPRGFGSSATSGASDVGHMAVATGEEGSAVASADSSVVPYVGIGGRDPSGNGKMARVNADRSIPVTGQLGDMAALADATANPTTSLFGTVGLRFNGTTWDRDRANETGTALASAARTATLQSSDIVNYNGRYLKVFINVTAITASPSVVFDVQEKEPISGTYTTLLSSAAITGTGLTVLQLGPLLTDAANAVKGVILPRIWRINATHADADSITYSVAYAHML